jgi:hypothetical protein
VTLALLAAALVLLPAVRPPVRRLRPPLPASPPRRAPPRADEPLVLAGGWDLLAACLSAGLPVATAVRAVVPALPPEAGAVLRRVGDLLALGSDQVTAWAPALEHPATAPLARGARRTARSGAALAGFATDLAVRVRAEADDRAEAVAQRAGVLVAAPLAACFLPAFLCLGVVPVVLGLAERFTTTV